MKQLYTSAPARPRFATVLGTLALGSALFLSSAAQAQTVRYEAEAATNTLTGTGIAVATDITPFSGTGYVNFNGDKGLSLAIPVTAATAGTYNLVIRYESQYGTTQPGYAKIGAYRVNSGPSTPVYFNGTAPGIPGATFKSTSNLLVTLTAGANTVTILDNGFGYFGVDYISLTPVNTTTALTPTAAGRVEAELGQLKGTQTLVRDDDTGTHSGASYVGSFSDNQTVGSTITLPVNIATAGPYRISVGARGIFSGKSFDLAVMTGTSTSDKVTTAVPESPGAFASVAAGRYNLAAGTNTITLTSQTGYLEIDYVDVVAATDVPTATRLNAVGQQGFAVYPNPATTGSLNVKLQAAAKQQTEVSLINTVGQRVRTVSRTLQTGENQFQIPTAGLATGLYQVVVYVNQQPSSVQRVVISQ